MLGVKIFRIFVVTISYILLCFKPDSSSSFFKSIAILALALLYDYYQLREDGKWYSYQNIVASIGMIIAIAFLAFGLFGVCGGLQIICHQDNILMIETGKDFLLFTTSFNIKTVLKWMALFPLAAFLELFNRHKRISQSNTTMSRAS